MNKICKRCQEEKSITEFGNNKTEKDGKKIYCRECELKRGREYREKNREKVNQAARNYRKNNPEKYKETIKKYLEKNPNMTSTERSRKYRESEEWKEKFRESGRKSYLKNIEKHKEEYKKYYHQNKKVLNKKKVDWVKKRRKKDGFFRMKENIRGRIRDFLNGRDKSKKTNEIVGLDNTKFKNYIESKFTDGMTWENYGKWHLDHIIPISEAKNIEELYSLNHYTNFQPLWAEDNLKKWKKI